MAVTVLRHRWYWLVVALVALAAILILTTTFSHKAGAFSSIEVVYAQPIRAGHLVPQKDAMTSQPSSVLGKPQADLPVDYFDFGPIKADAVVRHNFLIINNGKAPLTILRAYTTCGCTTADFTASVIPAGKASQVTITFDAGYHLVAGQTVRRGLILEVNDPDRPQLEIWVQADVSQ